MAEHLGRLLDFSMEPSTRALEVIERAYRSMPTGIRQRPLVQYAYAVALIRQRRYHDASAVLHKLVEDARDPALWRAKIWIELTLDERMRVMTDLEELSRHAAAHHQAGAERFTDKESAEFFGAVCGFLAGPWCHKVRDDDAMAIEDRLRAVLDDDARAAFDKAKTQVVERYQKLYKEHDERAQRELAAKSKELDDAQKAVDRKAQEFDKKQQALKDKRVKRDTERKTRIADIEAQLQKIDQQRQTLLAQIGPLEAERAALVAQLLPEAMESFMSPRMLGDLIRFRIQAEMHTGVDFRQNNRRTRRLLAPLVTKLTALEAQVASLNMQEFELRGQGFMTEVKHRTDLGKLAEQAQALGKSQVRIKYDARRLQLKTAAASPRLHAGAVHLTRFATYAPFPFEREKERLLGNPLRPAQMEVDRVPRAPADQSP